MYIHCIFEVRYLILYNNEHIIKIIVSTDFQATIRIDKKYLIFWQLPRKKNAIEELDLIILLRKLASSRYSGDDQLFQALNAIPKELDVSVIK